MIDQSASLAEFPFELINTGSWQDTGLQVIFISCVKISFTTHSLRGFMRHGYMYNGAFELNFPDLRPGTTTYKTTEGEERPLPDWPDTVDGIRIAYMEKIGKKFFAVRVQHADHDIVLEHPVYVDPMRHMNNRRFTAQPTFVSDDEASTLLDDIIRANPDKQAELALMINRVNQTRRAARTQNAS